MYEKKFWKEKELVFYQFLIKYQSKKDFLKQWMRLPIFTMIKKLKKSMKFLIKMNITLHEISVNSAEKLNYNDSNIGGNHALINKHKNYYV